MNDLIVENGYPDSDHIDIIAYNNGGTSQCTVATMVKLIFLSQIISREAKQLTPLVKKGIHKRLDNEPATR